MYEGLSLSKSRFENGSLNSMLLLKKLLKAKSFKDKVRKESIDVILPEGISLSEDISNPLTRGIRLTDLRGLTSAI